MVTFAEEVHREVFGALEGSYRWLDGEQWRKVWADDHQLWVTESGRTLSNVGMYEATINAR